MQAFNKCKGYKDYLSIINDSITNGIKYYDSNKEGFNYLSNIEEKDKSKIIKVMNLVDEKFSFKGEKNNEMNKKINYLLSLGIFSNNYKGDFDKLSPSSIYTLLVGGFSSFNDYNTKYLNIFLNEKLLSLIYSKSEFFFDIQDMFFMIKEHFEKLENKEDLAVFQNEMIERVVTDTLHDGVMNMQEYWNSENMEYARNIVRGVR
jgi:hypothetical protein